MKIWALYQAEKTNCLRCLYAWKISIFCFFLNIYLDLFKPLLQTTATSVTLIRAWFVLKPLRIFFPHVPHKHNAFQTPLINPWKIVSNTTSLPTGTSSVIPYEAAVFTLSSLSLLKAMSQTFPHILALLEVCSDSCIEWEAANTWVWPAINVIFPLILTILPFFLLSWLAKNPLFPHFHPWCAPVLLLSLVLVCDRGFILGLLLAGFPPILICEAPHKTPHTSDSSDTA